MRKRPRFQRSREDCCLYLLSAGDIEGADELAIVLARAKGARCRRKSIAQTRRRGREIVFMVYNFLSSLTWRGVAARRRPLECRQKAFNSASHNYYIARFMPKRQEPSLYVLSITKTTQFLRCSPHCAFPSASRHEKRPRTTLCSGASFRRISISRVAVYGSPF